MAYEYSDDELLVIPIPLFPGWGMFMDLFGQSPMRGPVRLIPGTVNAPSLTCIGDAGTGIYFPSLCSMGYAIYHMLRFLVDEQGVTFINELGHGGTVGADLLTEDQTYQLPDLSGTLALETTIQKTNGEAFSIQAGQPVCLDGSTDCVQAVATAYPTRAVGIAKSTTGSGNATTILLQGLHTMADWTNVVGSVGLTVDADYFLGAGVAGSLTVSPVDSSGNILQFVGKALTTQTLHVNIARAIVL